MSLAQQNKQMTCFSTFVWRCIVLSIYIAPVSVSLQSSLKPIKCSYKTFRPLHKNSVATSTNIISGFVYQRNIRLYSSTPPSSTEYSSSNSTSMEAFVESESMTAFSNKPPRRGPVEKLKRMLLLFTSIMVVLFRKIVPSSSNKTVNGAFDTSRKRRGTFEKLRQLLYLQLTSRRFWIQMIFLFSSFSIFSKILRFSRSLVTEVSYSSFMKLVSASPQRISDLKVSPSQFSFLLDGRSSFTRPVPLAPSMIDLLVSKGLEFSSPASPMNFIGKFIHSFIYL